MCSDDVTIFAIYSNDLLYQFGGKRVILQQSIPNLFHINALY